jgi:3-oxo-5-alpha-steroid 4-dehydrogenase 1
MQERKQSMPVLIVCFAFLFNAMNSTLNGRYLFSFSGGYSPDWFTDIRFIIGLVFFISGFCINYQSDAILLKLRNSSETAYRIPQGGLYRWVCCPNYLGEIIEWIGWALATWSLPGLVFAVWTMANLVPRARSNDRWYREHFPDYPEERKILIPGVW